MTDEIEIVVCEGDETGQELLEQALRLLDPGVLDLPIRLSRFDLSLANRRKTRNDVVHDAGIGHGPLRAGIEGSNCDPARNR